MRLAHKVDRNQAEIVERLRAYGASVAVCSAVGKGFPDLVVGLGRETHLVEVKDGSRPPSERRLTPAQGVFHRSWAGSPVLVFASVADVDAWVASWGRRRAATPQEPARLNVEAGRETIPPR